MTAQNKETFLWVCGTCYGITQMGNALQPLPFAFWCELPFTNGDQKISRERYL
jgi:hypothetical protein